MYITLMLTSPCATYVVSVKKNIAIYCTTKTYIYYRYHHVYISPKSVIGFFGSFVYVIVIVNFKCAMKNELPEINMRGQNLCYS